MPDVVRREKPRKPVSALKECDRLCGAIVRSRGRCEACGRSDGTLQWAHGFSRSYRKVRHDLRNGFCLCAGCHMKYTHDPIGWDEWMRARLGTKGYAELRHDATTGPRAVLKDSLALLQLEYARLGLPR